MLKIWNADVLEETVEEEPGTITEVNKKFNKGSNRRRIFTVKGNSVRRQEENGCNIFLKWV